MYPYIYHPSMIRTFSSVVTNLKEFKICVISSFHSISKHDLEQKYALG